MWGVIRAMKNTHHKAKEWKDLEFGRAWIKIEGAPIGLNGMDEWHYYNSRPMPDKQKRRIQEWKRKHPYGN